MTKESITFALGSKSVSVVYRVFSNEPNSSSYILIIGGWQSVKEIFYELIDSLNKNVIVFDYPGIGDNKEMDTRISNKSNEILTLLTKKLIEQYRIELLVGTSAGSTFIMANYDQFINIKRILLLSPQLSVVWLDNLMVSVFGIFLAIEKFINFPIYSKLMKVSSSLRSTWVEIVGKNSKREKSLEFVEKGILSAQKRWTLQQYLDLYRNKKRIRTERIVMARNVNYVIGRNDNLFDSDGFSSIMSMNDDRVFQVSSNHIVELESISELIDIINN